MIEVPLNGIFLAFHFHYALYVRLATNSLNFKTDVINLQNINSRKDEITVTGNKNITCEI